MPWYPISSDAAAASRRRPDPRWPAAPSIARLHAERSAKFRELPQPDSAVGRDRCAALQASRSSRPPSRVPSVALRLSRVNHTGKLGTCSVLGRRRRGQNLVIYPQGFMKTVLKLYDRTGDEITLDEVERIII